MNVRDDGRESGSNGRRRLRCHALRDEHCQRTFHRIQTKGGHRVGCAAGAKHIGRTDIAAAGTAKVDSAATREQKRKGHRAHEIAECDGQHGVHLNVRPFDSKLFSPRSLETRGLKRHVDRTVG